MHLIGQGAYAEVWAEGPQAHKIPVKNTDCPHVMLRESLLLRLDYGPPAQGLCTIDNSHYAGITMPRAISSLEKWPLFLLIHEGPAAMAYWFTNVLKQLQVMHKSKLVHCDIKGSNILIFESGDSSLCDFGLATIEHTHPYVQSSSELLLYTPNYRPIELLDTEHKEWIAAPSGDIWAFGMTILDCFLHVRSPDGPSNDIKTFLMDFIPSTCEARFTKFLGLFEKRYTVRTSFDHAAGVYLVNLMAKCLEFDKASRASASDLLDLFPWTGKCPSISKPDILQNKPTKTKPRLFTLEVFPNDKSYDPCTKALSKSTTDTLEAVARNFSQHVKIPLLAFEPAYKLVQILETLHVGSTVLLRIVVACTLTVFLYRPSYQLGESYCAKMSMTAHHVFIETLYQALSASVHYPIWVKNVYNLNA